MTTAVLDIELEDLPPEITVAGPYNWAFIVIRLRGRPVGQVRLPIACTPLVPSFYGSKYAGGFVEGPRCPVVVSRGVGLSVMPVRFQCRPDIVEVTLTRAVRSRTTQPR